MKTKAVTADPIKRAATPALTPMATGEAKLPGAELPLLPPLPPFPAEINAVAVTLAGRLTLEVTLEVGVITMMTAEVVDAVPVVLGCTGAKLGA